MNIREFHASGKKWTEHIYKRRHSLDYSRHLCGDTRQMKLVDKRPSKSFSDTDALGLSRHFTTHGPCGDSINKRTVTLVGQSSVERTSQKRVYHKDLSFHRKYGSKNEVTEMCAPSPVIPRSWVNSPTSSVYYEENDDDCARSFCDSVSSIACSHFTNNDVGKQTERRNILSDKVSKLKSIESWLQGVSKPLL